MEDLRPDAVVALRRVAARAAFGDAAPEEMIRAADAALSSGVYTDAILALADAGDPSRPEAERLLALALGSAGFEMPAPGAALAQCLDMVFDGIESAGDPAREFLRRADELLPGRPFDWERIAAPPDAELVRAAASRYWYADDLVDPGSIRFAGTEAEERAAVLDLARDWKDHRSADPHSMLGT